MYVWKGNSTLSYHGRTYSIRYLLTKNHKMGTPHPQSVYKKYEATKFALFYTWTDHKTLFTVPATYLISAT